MNQVHSKAIELSSTGLSSDLEWWVGISDTESDGTFKFESTGEIFPFTPKTPPWKGNEPDGGSDENCVTLNKGSPMEFSDLSCTASFITDDRKYHSVCEVSSSRTSATGDSRICFERDPSNPVNPIFCMLILYITDNIRITFIFTIIFQISAINVFWKQVLLIQPMKQKLE